MNHAGLWATAYSRPVFVDPSPAQLPCDDEGNSRIAGTWCDEPIVKIVAQDVQAVRVPHTPSATKAEVYTGAIRATVAAFDSQPPILEQSEAKSHSIKVLMQRLTARSGVFYEAAVSKEPTCRTTSQAYAPIDAGEGGVSAAIAVVVRVEQLTHKQTVYACLKATTRAGVVALHASQGVIVDATPPRLASLDGHVVSDLPPTRSPSDNAASGQVPMLPPPLGQGGDIDVDVTAVPGVRACFDEFTDPESHAITYEWSVYACHGSCSASTATMVQPWTQVPAGETCAENPTLLLQPEWKYFNVIRATNGECCRIPAPHARTQALTP